MRAAVVVTALALLASASVRTSNRVLCGGFLPKNNLRIPVGDISAAGISEAMFNDVLDKIQKVYGPIIASKGGKLIINRKWTDSTVNASAYQSGRNWYLNMYGGLARHRAITWDGMALVACHELGHHIGGYPKEGNWATNEGASDYFATLKCMRLMYDGSQGADPIDSVGEKGCAAQHPKGAARNLCQKGTMAGVSVVALFQDLSPQNPAPSLGTPDPSQVDQMYDDHPAGQCRLDTYFQGAMCTAKLSDELSDSEPGPGSCTKAGGYSVGLRSRCWYKPPQGEELTVASMPALRQPLPDAKALEERLESLRGALSGGGL
ncbi:MAG: hypothetical protein NTX64_00175 [Elusimicrobia bacterium]|nr:hypothetical protein [Elusimicrobiota bacterium]